MSRAFIDGTHSGGPYMYIEKYSNEIEQRLLLCFNHKGQGD